MDPTLVALFVGFAANVASDLVHDGVGWLVRTLRGPEIKRSNYDPSRLNLSLQAALVERGVSEASAIKAASFVLNRANLSYLLLLVYAANKVQVEVQRVEYLERFRREVRAHLMLEAGVGSGHDLDGVAECFSELLERAAASFVSASHRAPIEESAGKPSALFLFRNAEDRSQVFGALGEPDLDAYLQFTTLYNAAADARYGEIQLQHLGSNSPAVPIDSIYVQPTFSPFDPNIDRLSRRVLGMKQALSGASRKVFLGPAGIGKTTFVRFTAGRIAQMGADGSIAPFVIELRRLKANPEPGLFVADLKEHVAAMVQVQPPDGWLEYLLLTGRAVIFFDGFDEVLDLGDRARVRDAIRAFALMYVACDIVVTSRVNGYDAAPFASSEFACYEVLNFDPGRVRTYAEKWFAQRPQGPAGSTDVEAFVDESRRFADDLRQNPLMLSLLCNVYYYRGDIPRSLKELYERCAAMMFQEWDAIRGVEAAAAWDINLRPALFHLALTILNNSVYRGEGIPRSDIERELQTYWQRESIMEADHAADEAHRVVELWTGRAWIITAVGADEHNHPLFGFVHQSFLEYFAATALSRASDSPEALLANLQPRILLLNGWPVAQMAVSVFDAAHDQGGSRFAAELLNTLPSLPRGFRVTLLRFAIELIGIVRMARDVEQRIVLAALDVYSESVLMPVVGMNLAGLHEDSRALHARAQQEVYDDEEEADVEFVSTFVPPSPGSEDDFKLSTLDTEVLIEGVINACLDSEARQNLLLTSLTEWSTAVTADQAMVTVAFVSRLLRQAIPRTAAPASEIVDSIALSLAPSAVGWLFFAACLAAGATTLEAPELQLPWNTQVMRDSITLSFIDDVDVPSVLDAEVFGLLTDAERRPHLRAIGASFLELDEGGATWDPVVYDDPGLIALSERIHVGTIDTSGWDDLAFVGTFVLVALYLEIFGFDITRMVLGEDRNDFIAELLAAMADEVDPRTLAESWMPESVVVLVDRWTRDDLRLTSHRPSNN